MKGRIPWLVLVLMAVGLLLVYGGFSTYADQHSGTPGRARVTECTGGSGKYDRAVRCQGSWQVGGSLLDGGGVAVGRVEGAGYGDVGKEIDVRIHGSDHATKPALGTPIMLWAIGVPIVALGLWGLLAGMRRPREAPAPKSERSRDARFREIVVNVDEGWSEPDADGLARHVTPWLGEHLRKQDDAFRARGRVVHHSDTRIERLEIVEGGGAEDAHCLVRVTSTSKHWVTDAIVGEQMSGTRKGERVSRYWRFVRDPERGWLADEIGVAPPPGWPPITPPEPI